MKSTIQTAAALTIVILCVVIHLSYAQFQIVSTPPTNYLRTNAITRAVGIGNFTTPPPSALSVNTNLFPTGFQIGEVFRTQAPALSTQAWRMFSGTGAGTQRFALVNPGGSNDIFMGVVQSGNLSFFTNNIHRMRITPTDLYNKNINGA